MSNIKLQIQKLINVTEDTLCIYFKTPDNYLYRAGQYITLILDINGNEIRRPYSLSSYYPIDPNPFVTIKLVENGEASRYIHERLKTGDHVESMPPNGKFVLADQVPRQLFFMAAGSGISPVLGLMKQALYGSQARVVLLYSNRSPQSTIFYTQLKKLEETFAERLTIIWLFSNNKNLLFARLNRTLLEEQVKKHLLDRDDVSFYACGPFFYMEMIFITLITMGFNQDRLYKETFALPEDEEDEDGSLIGDAEAPNYVDALVHIKLDGVWHDLQVSKDQTILQAALKHKIKLPYSCKNGMCSTCTSQLISGEVHLHYNQVLTDREMANGRMLTCTAHPLTEIITIEVG